MCLCLKSWKPSSEIQAVDSLGSQTGSTACQYLRDTARPSSNSSESSQYQLLAELRTYPFLIHFKNIYWLSNPNQSLIQTSFEFSLMQNNWLIDREHLLYSISFFPLVDDWNRRSNRVQVSCTWRRISRMWCELTKTKWIFNMEFKLIHLQSFFVRLKLSSK